MKRAALEKMLVKRLRKEYKHFVDPEAKFERAGDGHTYITNRIDQLGRHRKFKHNGCRKTRCLICHNDKYPKRIRTNKEKMADERLLGR